MCTIILFTKLLEYKVKFHKVTLVQGKYIVPAALVHMPIVASLTYMYVHPKSHCEYIIVHC